MGSAITWAKHPPLHYTQLYEKMATMDGRLHWSRPFEYPWVIKNGNFQPGEWCLDAAGGSGPLQWVLSGRCLVVNFDCDPTVYQASMKFQPKLSQQVQYVTGDLRKIPYPDGMFHRVACVSVIEHIERPQEVVGELWRVTKPGGRLIVTMDIASYLRKNHTVDDAIATEIVGRFGLIVPDDAEAIRADFDEIDPLPDEPQHVRLRVLCFWADKPCE